MYSTRPVRFVRHSLCTSFSTVWAALSLSALKLLQPHLRSGAVIFIDNTIRVKEKYKDLLEYIDSDGKFSRIRLPYAGGLDMCRYEY